jgi:hypothetical protein
MSLRQSSNQIKLRPPIFNQSLRLAFVDANVVAVGAKTQLFSRQCPCEHGLPHFPISRAAGGI